MDLLPNSTISNSNWASSTAEALHTTLRKNQVNDSTYIFMATGSNGTCQLGLDSYGSMPLNTGLLTLRARKHLAAGNTRSITIELRKLTTLLHSYTMNDLSNSYVTYTNLFIDMNIFPDLTDLRISLVSGGTTGGSGANRREVHVSLSFMSFSLLEPEAFFKLFNRHKFSNISKMWVSNNGQTGGYNSKFFADYPAVFLPSPAVEQATVFVDSLSHTSDTYIIKSGPALPVTKQDAYYLKMLQSVIVNKTYTVRLFDVDLSYHTELGNTTLTVLNGLQQQAIAAGFSAVIINEGLLIAGRIGAAIKTEDFSIRATPRMKILN